ncbi:MAG: D-alanyl-D-alanine carboxypeptidase, partial [Firmicutes bacterium]|nr:D-alanyl-D-alanine carboxypeptidase [Bacillota bacterium]
LDAKGHYSSARDLGILTAAAMQNADFEKIVSTRSITIQNQTYVNHNRLLSSCEGCLGVKTGYTTSAGRSLVSCVERDGLELICVTLNDPDDWDDHMALYNWGFANFSCGVAVPAGEFMRIPVISGAAGDVGVAPEEEAAFLLQRDQALTLRVNLPRFVFAPIEEGSVAGNVEVYVAGELVGTVPLYYGVSVEKQKVLNFSPLERFQQIFALARANGARIAVLEGC